MLRFPAKIILGLFEKMRLQKYRKKFCFTEKVFLLLLAIIELETFELFKKKN